MPAGSPLSSRITAALSRWCRLLRLPRVVPLLLVVGAVAVVTIGAPMVTGAVTSLTDPVAFESAATPAADPPAAPGPGGSSSSSGGSVEAPLIQMGVDGVPAAEAPAPVPAPPPVSTPAAPTPSRTTLPGTTLPGTRPSPVPPAAPAAEVPAQGSQPGATGASTPEEPAADEAPPVEAEAQPAPVARAAAADPSTEGQVLALVNEARAAAGCGALAADAALAAVARAHSADMRDRDYFSHTSPEGLSPFDRAERAGVGYSRAENIAYGQADAAAVMEAWMKSPGHRANILDCELTKLGVGVAEGGGGPYWTQLFGA